MFENNKKKQKKKQAVAISSGFEIFYLFADIGFINVWWNQRACKFIDLLLALASSPCWDTAVNLSAQSPVASMPLSVLYKSNWLLFTQERLQGLYDLYPL